jgi:hypothetical protein
VNVDECVAAVEKFGLTNRQARFLVTVMRHSGVCVPRQYAAFVGTTYGHKVTKFFERLTRRTLATECGCLHNRAALYHVRNHALYRAIGRPDSRYRRPVSAGHAVDRLIRLDAVISHPELHWLGGEDEKVAFFGLLAPSCPSEGLPHTGSPASDSCRVRLFPDDLPIGITSTGMVVFFIALPMSDGDFRAVLQRHGALLQALPGWTVRLLFARDGAARTAHFEKMTREELTQQSSPRILAEFTWFCQERKATTNPRERSNTDQRFARARRAFGTARYELLYRRWLADGDRVFSLVSSPVISSAIERGTGRIESQILPFSYRHLAPLVTASSSSDGVEEGEQGPARPQPQSAEPDPRDESVLNA